MDTKKVSVKLAVQRALDTLGDEYTRYFDKMSVFAVEGNERIGGFYEYKRKIVVLPVNDCRAELPLGTKSVIGIILGDHGCDCGQDFEYANRIVRDAHNSYLGLAFGSILVGGSFTANFNSEAKFTSTFGGLFGCSDLRWEIQDNAIVFTSNIPNSISQVTVQILCYETDDDGLPMINHVNTQAVAKYIEWQMAESIKWRPGRQFTPNDRRMMQHEWNRLCSDARAMAGEPNPSQYREMTRLVNDPLIGYGLLLHNDYTDYYGGY